MDSLHLYLTCFLKLGQDWITPDHIKRMCKYSQDTFGLIVIGSLNTHLGVVWPHLLWVYIQMKDKLGVALEGPAARL